MGGKNAVIVMDDADLDLATNGILWSAFGTSGQRCTAASRVVVHRAVQKELAERLVARAGGMRLGDGLEQTTDVGPVVSANQLTRINDYVKIGQAEGARLATGGQIVRDGDLASGHFHQPTIFDDVKPDMRIAQEEIFGPVTTLIPVDSFDEAIDVVNGVEFGLSASIFTRDVNRAFRAMQDIFTGILYINAGTTGAEIHLPFGGTKGNRQRPPRSRHRRHGLLHRMAIHLRRLLRHPPTRPNRPRRRRVALSVRTGGPVPARTGPPTFYSTGNTGRAPPARASSATVVT